MSENKQSFREDTGANRPPKKSKSNMDSFTNVAGNNNDKDSPDQFIKKMNNTMSKKRKNNYKNIEELKNIYDDKKRNSEQYINYSMEDKIGDKMAELSEAFDEMEETMRDAFRPYSTEQPDKKKAGKRKNRKKKKKKKTRLKVLAMVITTKTYINLNMN